MQALVRDCGRRLGMKWFEKAAAGATMLSLPSKVHQEVYMDFGSMLRLCRLIEH